MMTTEEGVAAAMQIKDAEIARLTAALADLQRYRNEKAALVRDLGLPPKTCWGGVLDAIARLTAALTGSETLRLDQDHALGRALLLGRYYAGETAGPEACIEALADAAKKAEASLAETKRELERWRHGQSIEGDHVCPNALDLAEARREADQYKADFLRECEDSEGYATRLAASEEREKKLRRDLDTVQHIAKEQGARAEKAEAELEHVNGVLEIVSPIATTWARRGAAAEAAAEVAAARLEKAEEALRELVDGMCWRDEPDTGMVSAWWKDVTDTARLHRQAIAVLDPPSQGATHDGSGANWPSGKVSTTPSVTAAVPSPDSNTKVRAMTPGANDSPAAGPNPVSVVPAEWERGVLAAAEWLRVRSYGEVAERLVRTIRNESAATPPAGTSTGGEVVCDQCGQPAGPGDREGLRHIIRGTIHGAHEGAPVCGRFARIATREIFPGSLHADEMWCNCAYCAARTALQRQGSTNDGSGVAQGQSTVQLADVAGSRPAPTAVPPAGTSEVCGEKDVMTPRRCTKPKGHPGNHHDDGRCASFGGCPDCTPTPEVTKP